MQPQALLIDDAIPIHELVRGQIRHLGLELFSAYDGGSGISLVEALRPDVVLLDIDLPDIDGFHVCRRLKSAAITTSIPIIFLTADFSAVDETQGFALGAADYVTKPFKGTDLVTRISGCLAAKKSLEEKSMIDGMTGLWSQKYLEQTASVKTASAKRFDQPMSCIMLDIDGLQRLNLRHGIAFGDKIIRALANLLVSQCRTEDVVSHCGGGQFAILLPGKTRAGAAVLVDRLAAQVESQLRHHGVKEVGLTCSFGVADCAVSGDLSLIERAEQALLRAKLNGGDCISIARPLRNESSRAA